MGVSRLVVYQRRTPSNELLYPQYHLPSCIRILEASHIADILCEAGHPGLVDSREKRDEASELGSVPHRCRHAHGRLYLCILFGSHSLAFSCSSHSARSCTDAFATNRISFLIDSGKSIRELSEFQASGPYVVQVLLNLYSNSLFSLEDLSLNMSARM